MKNLRSLISVPLLGFALGCGAAQETPAMTPSSAEAPAGAEASDDATASMNIVQKAEAAGSFSTLLAAVKAADLQATLEGPGPFTVFAPTDEAFKKLPAGTVENLLKPENKAKLAAVLTYHVVSGKVAAADVANAKMLKTVQGQELTVAEQGGQVRIDGAQVVKADIMASNGVIHVIDTVVLPK